MHEKLWAGVGIKFQHAAYHFDEMGRSLQPPERTRFNVAQQTSGAIIDTGWQRSFYAHLDAFLSAARSVPWIIQCCFGVDLANKLMEDWFNKDVPSDEQCRRREFTKQFETHYSGFGKLRLSTARNISEHRTGVVPVTVTINRLFGVPYIGNPAEHVPIFETRQSDDSALAFLDKPNPIQPSWGDFDIEGQPLFPACQDYLNGARALMDEARRIALLVHGTNSLSSPPT